MSMKPEAISVCDNKIGLILVGTRGGEIIEFHEQQGNAKVHMRSHYNQQLWGLAPHPTRAEVFTFDREGMLAVWDLTTRKQIKQTKMLSGGDAIAISSDAKYLVIGYLNG